MKVSKRIKDLLNEKVEKYNQPNFITNDPIQIPHQFTKRQDIEIMGFFAATLAWGQRVTIINNCKKLITLFDSAPHDFILNHKEEDLKLFLGFKHRTFNEIDLLYFISFLKFHYQKFDSLEYAFTNGINQKAETVEPALLNFNSYFTSLDYFPQRTSKHVATPARKSACKRLNMYLRWMVRDDNKGVDFGLWKTLNPSQLLIPFDVHVARVARSLGLVERKQNDFLAVLELTETLRTLDREDPVKYDYALFGMGVEEKKY